MGWRPRVCLLVLMVNLAWVDLGRAEVRIAGSAWVGDGPTKVAAELGLFNQRPGKDEPLIEVLDLDSGLAAMEMLMRGEAEFALAATTPVALALLGAMDQPDEVHRRPVVLASVALSNQTHKLVVHPDAGITVPAQLQGRRIGIMRDTSSHYGWWQFASFHELGDDAVELVDLRVRDMAEALLAGHIDAALIWEPWDQILAEALGQAPQIFELRMLYTVNWLLLAEREFAMANPELLERVLAAYRDTIDFMDREPERSLTLHARRTDLTGEELRRRREGILWRLGMNWSVLVDLGGQFEWLATRSDLAGKQAPEPWEYLYGGPLGRLAPQLVTLPNYLLLGDAAAEPAP